MLFALLGLMNTAVIAAELLEVKPVVAGSAVSVEISADVAMTYTFYKVPGQARAVVDIAEADPEKVEPLIVVNKGVISSISVDKAQISGIVVSRIIFNLVSEADIAVTATSDRKLLTVTFGGAAASTPAPKAEAKPVPLPEPVAKTESPVTTTAAAPAAAGQQEDPLGLDEPAAKAPAPPGTAQAGASAAAATLATPTVMRIPKLEPVVPAATAGVHPAALMIKDIATGASYIEIRTNQTIVNYKATRLTAPGRLFFDIACEKTDQKPKTIAINKFGIAKARIGVTPKNVRIVFDSDKPGFPAYTITGTEYGLRINFK